MVLRTLKVLWAGLLCMFLLLSCQPHGGDAMTLASDGTPEAGPLPDAPAAPGAVNYCPALAPAETGATRVTTVSELVTAVNNATEGETIVIADGTYLLDGAYLRMDVAGVTVRSESGNCEAVVLDGNYITTEIFQIVASNITVADLTLREVYNHPIHVMSTTAGDVTGTLIYNVHIIDPGQQAIKINPYAGTDALYFPDAGEIACSHIELTDEGREHIRDNCYTGGVDAHQAQGWTIRDNLIEGFWCESDLSEHAIHMWRSCKDTLIYRNHLRDNARGVGLGLVTTGDSGIRTYPEDPCPEAVGYVDDFGGTVFNNMISVLDPDLFNSAAGFDCGICFWNACDSKAYHNTVYTADVDHTFSAIEWRFSNTAAEIFNNLTNEILMAREGAVAELAGNETEAMASWFFAPAAYDFHLVESASSAIDQGQSLAAVPLDFEGDSRTTGAGPDIGADEFTTAISSQWFYLPICSR
jgi:hypothetical protein